MEHSPQNLCALNATLAPPCHESSQESSDSQEIPSNENSTVESLMQLFFSRFEAAKENSEIEDDLPTIESE